MKNIVLELHKLLNNKHRFSFPFTEQDIPRNGIYILFEKGETFGEYDRIVRVGTHTGENQLRSRLRQHFINENKNRSIFRKNIGRCLLAIDNHNYQSLWEIDTTSKLKKEEFESKLDKEFEKYLEEKISGFIRANFSFCTFEVDSKEKRIYWESKIASTLNQAHYSKPSNTWLGNFSPKDKIRSSGLWQVNELNKDVIDIEEFSKLVELL